MSSGKLSLIILLCVLVVMGGAVAYVYTAKHSFTSTPTTQVMKPVTTPSPTSTLPSGNSNAQLQQDTQSIDDSMNALDSDVSSLNQSLNDQQTNLQ